MQKGNRGMLFNIPKKIAKRIQDNLSCDPHCDRECKGCLDNIDLDQYIIKKLPEPKITRDWLLRHHKVGDYWADRILELLDIEMHPNHRTKKFNNNKNKEI